MAIELNDDILDSARQGNEFALTCVYRSLAPGVLGYFRARGATDPEASVNDVFVSVFARLPRFHGTVTALRSFVYSVAHARLVDDYRRQHRRPTLVVLDEGLPLPTVASAEAEAMERLDGAGLAAVLARLPDDQAEVIVLRIVAGLSVAQVAEAMKRSEGAVKQLQRRGLLRLRELLGAGQVTR
ncbi:MAG TPA: RNA polymerase sigma factor [Jatrophihabitans sp.]|nr:RNA polymerase sigma factor [Jatrophihabitans sp.]